MSFILEALKRADRERRLERAPDLSAVYEENNLPRHTNIRPWLWLSGSLLVGLIVVGLMIWPEGPGPVKTPLPRDESASRPPSAPAPTGREKVTPPSSPKGSEGLKPKRPSVQASSRQRVPRPLRKAKPARPIRSVTEKKAPAKTESKPVEKVPNLRPVSRAKEITRTRPSPVAGVEKRESVRPAPLLSSIPKDAPMEPEASDQSKAGEKLIEAVAVSPAEPPPAPVAKEQVNRKRTEAIPLISELPYEIKQKLGKLQINVHSYSKDPAECLVIINMHSCKVGDKIGEGGPLLKEITPDGVIIDYGEGEARLQVW